MSETHEANRATKEFYAAHHDRIFDKRFNSPFPIRRRVHREMYESVSAKIEPGMTVLDAGCGEGVLSILMARRGALVTGIDYSTPNIEAAVERAREAGLSDADVRFEVGDVEALPFADDSFECVVSNHVLEHLPDFERGVREIRRVTRSLAVIAVPTCLNPCSWALLGGDVYWKLSKRSPVALARGIARVALALVTGRDGVNEGYAGVRETVHVFRFPWVVRRILERNGFEVLGYEAQSLSLPWVTAGVRLRRSLPGLRNLGFGTVYLVRKTRKESDR